MFVVFDKKKQKVPIKIWLDDRDSLDKGCLEQALNLSNLPFVHRHVALMPDTHQGYGMPIGGVIACDGVIIPHAVGNDIGCGMVFVQTDIPVNILLKTETGSGNLIQAIVGNILRNIPVGFERHKTPQPCGVLNSFSGYVSAASENPELMREIDQISYQMGTLGSGNHFIEIQADENNNTAVMIHSGSRNFGLQVCKYFNKRAEVLNEKWDSPVPRQWQLAYLPVESGDGAAYIEWMNFALEFARENREKMMTAVKGILYNMVKKYVGFSGIRESLEVNAHHNYAAFEQHYGKSVWVHRKGAIRAERDELGIIPGAMGSYSYIVRGLGSREGFMSCSHGAGRKLGRKEASRQFKPEMVIKDLKDAGVILGKSKKSDIAEECRLAYKDIDYVIKQELDLIEPVKKLKTVAVVKG